jgi:hypothetical protein
MKIYIHVYENTCVHRISFELYFVNYDILLPLSKMTILLYC